MTVPWFHFMQAERNSLSAMDCSSGICANVRAVGYICGIKALQKHGGSFTGNMRAAFRAAGFTVLTDSKILSDDNRV